MPLKVDLNDVEPTELSVDASTDLSLESLASGEVMAEIGASCVAPPHCSCCAACCCCWC